MRKSFICLMLGAAVLVGAASGCAKPSGSQGGSGVQEESLSIHYHGENRFTILDEKGEILPVFQLAGEKTNVRVVNVANPVSQNSIEEFQLQATEKFPADIYGGVDIKSGIYSYAMQGAFLPLNGLIEEHGPNVKKYFDENPHIKAAMTAPDGNIYMLNYIPDGQVGRTYFIRMDWLENLGLPMPQSFEELETALYAFKDQDPNGNGLKDEIPYFNDRWQEMIRLVNLWGARAYGYDDYSERIVPDHNGQMYHAWTAPEFKEGLLNLKRWYADGIIDPEIFTRKAETARQTLWAKDNTGGMTHEWLASTASYNYKEDLLASVPEFKVEAMLPVNALGKAFEEHQRASVKPSGWAISSNCKNPEAAIRYMDWFFSEEGSRAINFGIEGRSYTIVDGKPQFMDEVLKEGAVNLYLKMQLGAQTSIGYAQDYEYERQWTVKEGVEAYDLYAGADIWSEAYIPVLNFTEDEREIFDGKITNLNLYLDEQITAFITGKEDLETGWDSYVERAKQLGSEELVEVYSSAYERYKSTK